MPLKIRPAASPDRELDLRHALTAAVAHELWRHTGGNEILNWLEAERFVERLSLHSPAPVPAPPARPPATRRPHPHTSVRVPRRRPQEECVTGPIPVL